MSRLCMFHPVDQPMVRGWVGRVDGDRVVQLAAQTLQSFFTGGGTAREHAVYPLDGVRLLAPVLHPPSVRVFDSQTSFAFANPAAIVGPDAAIRARSSLVLVPRVAAVIGADCAIAGYTIGADWRSPEAQPPKDRDFALGLGPVVVSPDELEGDAREAIVRVGGAELLQTTLPELDWAGARDLALDGTSLVPGDVLVGPAGESVDGLRSGSVELEVPGIGTLRQIVGDTD